MSKMMRNTKYQLVLLAGLAAMLWLTGCLTGCADKETSLRSYMTRTLSVDCAEGTIIQQYDSHGGFHGDGTSFYAIQFPDGTRAETVAGSGSWKPLPLTKALTAQVWGLEEDGDLYCAPSVIKSNDWNHPLIPPVTNGYYFFHDRHSAAVTPTDDSPLLDGSRSSYNFTVAIYDTDTNILYFAEVDT